MSDIAIDQMTVREAFETFYVDDSDLGKGAKTTMRSSIKVWEKLTENPPVREITNATAAQFRQAAIEAEYAPATINSTWRAVRTILRRIGPITDGNPWAMELIPRVPAMRPVHEPFKRPRRLSMEELSRLYLAARWMKNPTRNVPNPGFWWQALIVVAYFTGLRVSDLLKIKWTNLDEQNSSLYVRIQKTGVEADLPLPEVAMVHLARLERRGPYIFRINKRKFFEHCRTLKQQARIENFEGFHDIRRTSCSEADRIRPGMGKVLLLHAPQSVTEVSYLNSLPELRGVVEQMEIPPAFRHGPKMAMRMIRETKKAFELRPRDFTVPIHPPKALFTFTPTGFTFFERFIPMSPRKLKLLETFIEGDGIAKQDVLWQRAYGEPIPMGKARHERRKLITDLSAIRQKLKKELSLPNGFNPIVPTVLHEARQGRLCQYELLLPPALWQDEKASG